MSYEYMKKREAELQAEIDSVVSTRVVRVR
jgi:hypothetical protein